MPGLAEQRHERQTRKHTKAHQHGHVLERNNRGLLVERVKHRERLPVRRPCGAPAVQVRAHGAEI